MTNGFLRIASVAPIHKVADVEFNVSRIQELMVSLERKGVEIAVFPELCITGYTCADLFHNQTLLAAAQEGLEAIRRISETMNLHVIVGLPRRKGDALMNSAAFVHEGVVEYIDKTYLPSYNEFYEKRWFKSADPETQRTFRSHGAIIGIEICEDLWAPIPPSSYLALKGAQIVFNLSASDDQIGKHNYLLSLIRQQSGRCVCAYAYSSAGFGESTTDLVFLPKTVICENGSILDTNEPADYTGDHVVIADVDIEAIARDRMHLTTFSDCAGLNGCINNDAEAPVSNLIYDTGQKIKYRRVDPHPFVPASDDKLAERCREITVIQECGLASRLAAIGQPKIVVGISGGLDSTLALLVAVSTMKCLGRPMSDIIAVTMPGFGTTDRTYTNALSLMEHLGVDMREIPIGPAVTLHFKDIGQNPEVHDVTYENSQARERTQILMDLGGLHIPRG